MRIYKLLTLTMLLAAPSTHALQMTCTQAKKTVTLKMNELKSETPARKHPQVAFVPNQHVLYDEILLASKQCTPLRDYIGGKFTYGSPLICAGELFAPAVYEGLVLTSGSWSLLLNTLAPAAGWNCVETKL